MKVIHIIIYMSISLRADPNHTVGAYCCSVTTALTWMKLCFADLVYTLANMANSDIVHTVRRGKPNQWKQIFHRNARSHCLTRT